MSTRKRERRRAPASAGLEGFDEFDDVYDVKRVGPGEFQVRHFPDPVTRRACCRITVKVRDTDRGQDRPREVLEADPDGSIATLHRAYVIIEKRHGRYVVANNVVDNNPAA